MNTATKDFSRKTLAALAKKGIAVIGATFVPGADGTFANGERAYQLDNAGQHQIRTFGQVLALAK
jgi:hypothetical protein